MLPSLPIGVGSVDPAQKMLLANLDALRRAIGATSVLRSVLDADWFEAVEQKIKTSSAPLTTDPSGFLYDFCHPFRGVEWFEHAQQLALDAAVPWRLEELPGPRNHDVRVEA
jgi:hypothetical protein